MQYHTSSIFLSNILKNSIWESVPYLHNKGIIRELMQAFIWIRKAGWDLVIGPCTPRNLMFNGTTWAGCWPLYSDCILYCYSQSQCWIGSLTSSLNHPWWSTPLQLVIWHIWSPMIGWMIWRSTIFFQIWAIHIRTAFSQSLITCTGLDFLFIVRNNWLSL